MSAEWGIADKLRMYRKALSALGPRGFLDRRRAHHVGDCYVHPPWSNHPLYVRRDTSDLLVFDQIFVDREYRCIDHLRDVRLIIDAGANVGYSSAYLLFRFPEAQVVALEPDDGNFEAARRNLAQWGDRVRLLHAALWRDLSPVNLRRDTAGRGEEWGRKVEQADGGMIKTFDMPTIIEEHGPIDLLKVDIEGAEKQVFGAADLSWLDQVRNIVIELHSEEDRRIFHKAIQHRGYTVTRCEELTVCLS